MTKSQIVRLGERLRKHDPTEADLRALDEYRRSFRTGYMEVEAILRGLGLEATGRPEKTPQSIIAKLIRERSRLNTIQDIAGCRLTAAHTEDQDRIVSLLSETFAGSVVYDRRLKPSNGYRAVHLIATENDTLVELQIRTRLQHLWAQISEALDKGELAIKYGRGPETVLVYLAYASKLIAAVEQVEPSGGLETLKLGGELENELETLRTRQ